MAFDILKLTSRIMDAICKKARETGQSENEVSFQMESAARAATVKKTVFNMMDAARYQGNIDWDAVKASGKDRIHQLEAQQAEGRPLHRPDL